MGLTVFESWEDVSKQNLAQVSLSLKPDSKGRFELRDPHPHSQG